MPNCPVTFDFATATEAAAECRRHARYLDSLAETRADARPAAVAEWRGRFRDDFDREFTRTQQRLSDEASSLRALAGAIDDAIDAARRQRTICERDHDHRAPDPVGSGPR